MSITAHLWFIYAIQAVIVGMMVFDSINPTYLHSAKIASIKNDILQNLTHVFENRFISEDKIPSLRKEVFVDVMKEIKTIGLITEKKEKSGETLNTHIDDSDVSQKQISHDFDANKDNMKTDKYKEKSISKAKPKRNNNRSSAISNLKHDKIDTSLKNQKDLNTKQHDVDISFQSSTQILQQLNTIESNERKLQESSRQRYCHRSPFLSSIDSVDNFPWDNQTSDVMNDIRSLSSYETLSSIHTSQYKAACWILYDDVRRTSVEDELTLERYALAVILHSANQDVEMMLVGDSCDLDGIECDDIDHIIEIN